MIFHIEEDLPVVNIFLGDKRDGVWTMYFDGSISKEGFSAGAWIICPYREFTVYSFKLTFECTNNLVEYEAMILGLKALNELKTSKIDVSGESKLVINQVNGTIRPSTLG